MRFLSLTLALFALCGPAIAQMRPVNEIFVPAGDFPVDKYAKVAVLQWAPKDDAPLGNLEAAKAYKQKNREILERFIREAHANGAEMVITPEFGVVGYPDIPDLPSWDDNFRNREDIAPYVETIPGPTTEYFSKLTAELGIIVHVGFAEIEPETNRYYNVVAAIGPEGLIASYRKQNLFRMEHNFLSAGEANVEYDSPYGKVGIIICADVYDQRVMDGHRLTKPDLIGMSTSWTQHNSGWGFYVRGAVHVGTTLLVSNHDYFPDAGVINPDGSTQSHIRQSSGLAYGYILRR